MEPTLFGIKVTEQQGRGVMDYLPLSLVKMVLFGERYIEVKSPARGRIKKVADEYLSKLVDKCVSVVMVMLAV